jgi:hypothetical protein
VNVFQQSAGYVLLITLFYFTTVAPAEGMMISAVGCTPLALQVSIIFALMAFALPA